MSAALGSNRGTDVHATSKSSASKDFATIAGSYERARRYSTRFHYPANSPRRRRLERPARACVALLRGRKPSRAICNTVQRGRDQFMLLPPPSTRDLRALGSNGSARLSLRGEASQGDHARQSLRRYRRPARALPWRGHRAWPKARAGPRAASAELCVRRHSGAVVLRRASLTIRWGSGARAAPRDLVHRSEEHTSELQSQSNLV